jgi:hypothetical protein
MARAVHGASVMQPRPQDKSLVDRLGQWCGALMAPITGLVSNLRQARMFHPDGVVYLARVEPIETAAVDLREVAGRLSGRAVVRLSSAWWRGGKEWMDVLGLALRFVRPNHTASALPEAGDQDLLLATIRFPWTTPLAPLATRVSSFLWNDFHAVSPFAVEGLGRVKLRLRSPKIANGRGQSRAEHLAGVVAANAAVYELQARRLERPVHRRSWEGFAKVVLERPIDVDQAALRFSPFLDGRGVRPVGFVHHLRLATYAASQRARPASEPGGSPAHSGRGGGRS